MSALKMTLLITLIVVFTASCSVMSPKVIRDAGAKVPFKTLVGNMDKYVGKTVVLGGYILAAKHSNEDTIVAVLQAPLTRNGKPKSKHEADGRFIIVLKGLLALDGYTTNREVTVAGTVVEPVDKRFANCPSPCLTLASREIYLWSVRVGSGSDPKGGTGETPYWHTNQPDWF